MDEAQDCAQELDRHGSLASMLPDYPEIDSDSDSGSVVFVSEKRVEQSQPPRSVEATVQNAAALKPVDSKMHRDAVNDLKPGKQRKKQFKKDRWPRGARVRMYTFNLGVISPLSL